MTLDEKDGIGSDETVLSVKPQPTRVLGRHVGRVLSGKYKLLTPLGSGGMGEVYKAEHVALGTPLAVKTMHPHIAAQPELARRFGREANAASRLRHPNVVEVRDYGEDEGLFYIVMELLEGRTVGDLIARSTAPPPLAEVQSILVPVLDALDRAHASGIVHRDLKPENIFLAEALGEPERPERQEREGGGRVVKVVDFGLAHVEDPRDKGPTLTHTDAMGGTPEYMSPEQCRSLSVGPSADLYSIGCVLTALLQLRPPFSDVSPVDVISKHMFLPPPPLARPAGAEPVPPLLERLRLELLAKSPAKRPRDAAEAKARFLEAMSPEATLARLPTRKGDEPLGARAERLPDWSVPSVRGRRALVGATSSGDGVKIGLLRARSEEGGVGSACVTGLAAQSLHAAEVTSISVLKQLNVAAVIIDAGADIEQACAFLRALQGELAGCPALVCAKKPGIEAINAMIAAGAADVVTYPVSPDTLGRKLTRVLRRGR
jgi:serine/threonine protein kinase